MGPSLRKLLKISSPSFFEGALQNDPLFDEAGANKSSWLEVLCERNGFYAFESALRFFPSDDCVESYGLKTWNSNKLWKKEFGELAENLIFFAEDVFGTQFGFQEGSIIYFNPETGDHELIADTLESWAERILDEFDVLTGYQLAEKWQSKNGPIGPRKRLFPKIPFVLGGAYDSENLFSGDVVERMRFNGSLVKQIENIPDGGDIQVVIE